MKSIQSLKQTIESIKVIDMTGQNDTTPEVRQNDVTPSFDYIIQEPVVFEGVKGVKAWVGPLRSDQVLRLLGCVRRNQSKGRLRWIGCYRHANVSGVSKAIGL